jgi:hypothetical protein
MNTMRTLAFAALTFVSLSGTPAQAGGGSWSVGIRFGTPAYYRPYHYHPPFAYYRPYPVLVEPAPVVVRPVPVWQPVPVVQPVYPAPAQVVQPAYPAPAPAGQPTYQAPPPAPLVAPPAGPTPWPGDVDHQVQLLRDPAEQVRAEAVLQLGRLKAERAVDPLAATLAGDRSPVVREAAARALGLIGSAKALTALQYAAQADSDRDVRHSAKFAIEVIQSR